MKTCTKCGEAKPLDGFSPNAGCADGLAPRCKACRAAKEAARRGSCPERTHLTLMIQRCHNPRHPKFHHYGGRGITVHEAWRGDGGLEAFLEHIGPKPSPKHEVDRIDNGRGYEPGNVRWATRSEQMQNTRVTVRISAFGKTQTLCEWARETGIRRRTLEWRRDNGWEPERILTQQVPQRRAS